MKKKFLVFITLIGLMLISALLASCELNPIPYFDGASNKQRPDPSVFVQDFAYVEGHILKHRQGANSVAYAKDEDGELKLMFSSDWDAPYRTNGWVVFGHYILSFYETYYDNVINVYDTRMPEFESKFAPLVTYKYLKHDIADVKEVDSELYITIYASNVGSVLLEKTSFDGEDTFLNQIEESKAGYLVLVLGEDEGRLTERLGVLTGSNPKNILVNEQGVHALFRVKGSTYSFVRYDKSTFEKIKSVSINMYTFERLYVDGDYIIILSLMQNSNDYALYSKGYALFVYDSNLACLDSVVHKDFSVSDYSVWPNDYRFKSIERFPSGLAEHLSHSYSFNGKKLVKTEIRQVNSVTTRVDARVYHSKLGYDNPYTFYYNNSEKRVILFDATDNRVISQANVPEIHYRITQIYFNADINRLYYSFIKYFNAKDSYVCFMDITERNSTVEFIATELKLEDAALGVKDVTFDFFRVYDQRVVLVYSSLIIEYDAELNQTRWLDFRKPVTIHFLNEDGSQAAPSIVREAGGKITTEEIREIIPTREGYIFVKWVKEEEVKLYNLSIDVVLTAVWEEVEHESTK